MVATSEVPFLLVSFWIAATWDGLPFETTVLSEAESSDASMAMRPTNFLPYSRIQNPEAGDRV